MNFHDKLLYFWEKIEIYEEMSKVYPFYRHKANFMKFVMEKTIGVIWGCELKKCQN